MSMSRSARKAYQKAVREKKKRRRGHWLLIRKGDSAKEIASKLFTQLCVLVLVGCGAVLFREGYLSVSAQLINRKMKSLYEQAADWVDHMGEGEILPGAASLLEVNPDTVGYIRIDGTEVDMPIVQAADNDKYLTTAFDGSSNKAGSIFLDYRCRLGWKEHSDNIVLYGHNQRDRTMFGSLKDYKHNIDHYKAHPVITLYSNYEKYTYKIFAYFVIEAQASQTYDGVLFDYHNYIDLSDRSVYDRYMENVMLRSQIITPVDVRYGDEFLTLSTCSNEFEPSRFVIIARKTRPGEDETTDVSSAAINPDAKEPDWGAIY
ncbi:MAG: class B sortase [Oscillospiraceae bacterium]|nr:class B sortase [Oscillospiraceae bacterium]